MSQDVQFFAQCDHVVDDEFYGMRNVNSPTRVIAEGTMLYNFNGTWTSQLPISSPEIVYVPMMNVPSGTVQYYLNDTWENALPTAMVTNGTEYIFILGKNVSDTGQYAYYYYDDAIGDFAWNSNLPSISGSATIVPVIPKSQIVTQYFYNGIWSNNYPNLSVTTVYIPQMMTATGNLYYYNAQWTPIVPTTLVNISVRVSSFGTQQYFYNNEWNSIAPSSKDGSIFIYIQSLDGSTPQYFYNNGWNLQAPTDFEIVQTRTLLNQSLLYLYNDTLQEIPPMSIFSPLYIQTQDVLGIAKYQYNGAWNTDVPNQQNVVFSISNPTFLDSTTHQIETAFYYNDNWQIGEPLIMAPNIEVDVKVQKNGSLIFNYNGQDNEYPPTEVLIYQQRTLQEAENQYYYDGTWHSTPLPKSDSVEVFYIPTQVSTQDAIQYYYNNQWNDVQQRSFDPSMCPKCYGKGYYFDISFNNAGQAILTQGSIKLEQEILKILIDQQGGNIFHPEWGTTISSKLLAHKNTGYTQVKLQFILSQAINYLKQLQISNQTYWRNMTPDEMIDSIASMSVIPINPSGYLVNIDINTQAGVTITHQFQL